MDTKPWPCRRESTLVHMRENVICFPVPALVFVQCRFTEPHLIRALAAAPPPREWGPSSPADASPAAALRLHGRPQFPEPVSPGHSALPLRPRSVVCSCPPGPPLAETP